MRILCAVAMLLAGIQFQPILAATDTLSPAELAQYRLPDGSLPIFCITYTDADGKEHGKVYTPGCDACQITAAIILPAPQTTNFDRLAFQPEPFVFPRAKPFRRTLYPPNTGPRAPPRLLRTAV